MFQLLEAMPELQFYLFCRRCYILFDKFHVNYMFKVLLSDYWRMCCEVFAEVMNLLQSLQVKPPCSFRPEETEYLTKRSQDGGTEVVQVSLKPWMWANDASFHSFKLQPMYFSINIQALINSSICLFLSRFFFQLSILSRFFNLFVLVNYQFVLVKALTNILLADI